MCTGSGTTAHNPRSGGDPRLEGDPTPRRREPPQPEPVACRAHSHGLEVTHGLAAGLEVTHGQGSVLGLPCLIPAGLEVTHGLGLPPGVAVPTGMSFAN
uniref:Uncharacterized protein n=1 Tax=Fagus sylvatica TaxID=28930 RepID=A0A2N9I1A7_FAGSY